MQRQLTLLDRYILRQLASPLIFSIAMVTILGELIGITFEQIRFVARSEVSATTSMAVHLLKLPAFFSIGFPLALLLATLITCSELSRKSEATALRAIGVSSFRMMLPILVLGLVSSGLAFIFHEIVVPPANYQAARLLEKEWGVDRARLAKYNQKGIVYLQYDEDLVDPELSFVFSADQFDGQRMQKVTFLRYEKYNSSYSKLREIVVSDTAQWNELKKNWDFFAGQRFLLSESGSYEKISLFKTLSIQITRDIFDYVDLTRDRREMNLVELYHRLRLIKSTKNPQKIRQLQMSIQERYAFPFSGFVFAYLGTCIGLTACHNEKSDSFGIAILVIIAFYIIQAISNYLSVAGIIPAIWGAWMPNALGLVLGFSVTRYQFS